MVLTLPSLMVMASACRVGSGGARKGGMYRGEENKKQEGQGELFVSRDICLFGYRHYNFEHPKRSDGPQTLASQV